jgi:hypothetical protein
MELARSFAEGESPPKRTIAFLTFAAEEQGLLGSKAFVASPSVDLADAVVMLNFDMTGHGDGKVGIGGGEYYPDVWDAFTASLDSSRADSLKTGRTWNGDSSDHAPFRNAGIPVCNVWSEGGHRFYHTPQDDARWIETFVLDSLGRMAEGWIRTLADWPEPLLVPHRGGRTLLYAADQIDFDGTVAADAPTWVRAGVRWLDAGEFAGPEYVETLADLHARAAADEIALLTAPGKVHGATADGKRATLLGLRRPAGLPDDRRSLLGPLEAGVVEWSAAPASDADSTRLDAVVDAGVVLLVSPEADVLAALPDGAKRCIRLRPGQGETVAEPDSIPQMSTLFVLSLDGPLAPADVVAAVEPLGAHRVHLDLVPWLENADETTLFAWLEELQAVSGWDRGQMAALLGGNLGRL